MGARVRWRVCESDREKEREKAKMAKKREVKNTKKNW